MAAHHDAQEGRRLVATALWYTAVAVPLGAMWWVLSEWKLLSVGALLLGVAVAVNFARMRWRGSARPGFKAYSFLVVVLFAIAFGSPPDPGAAETVSGFVFIFALIPAVAGWLGAGAVILTTRLAASRSRAMSGG